MKLTDIKKLKVPELRSRLKDLELDTKGLKNELIGRLWSALETRQSAEVGKEELKLQTDPSPTQAETVRAPSSSPTPPEAGVTARRRTDCTREFADSATQTETDAELPPPRQHHESVSACVPVYQAEEGDAERGEMGRGRAFYEFKEEIRYKR